jgi:predicted dehydrogenase
MKEPRMRIALVGCGYVADYYMGTLPNHPGLRLIGVMDRDEKRAAQFAAYYSVPRYDTLQQLLDDDQIDLVINLTNPASHFEVTRACLEAGKHVYSEKPLAMTFAEASQLVALAEARGLELACAPCSILGETAQTLWRLLRQRQIGQARLVFAELSGGPVHMTAPQTWRSVSGAPWPYVDEFQVGATLEHAAYYVNWLVTFFGPARQVTSYAACVAPDKGAPLDHVAPDFTVASIEFASGVVARLTCDIFAPSDHSLRIIGDGGILSIADCWDYGSPILFRRRTRARLDDLLDAALTLTGRGQRKPGLARPPLAIRLERHARLARLAGLGPKKLPLARQPRFRQTPGASRMDYARGPMEMADAVAEGRASRLPARAALHVNEIVLAIHESAQHMSPYTLTTTCEPIEPLPWAST